MKKFALLALLPIATSLFAASVPDGWKTVIDRKKLCQYSVPSSWMIDSIVLGSSNSADKKTTALVRGTDMGQSLADAKKTVVQILPPEKIIEDTTTRFWYSYKKPNSSEDVKETNWYFAIPAKGNICAAQISFQDAAGESVARKIIDTITPMK